MENRVFILVSGDEPVEVPFKSDDVTLVIINKDYLEDYTFIYREEEVSIDSINDDGSVNLIMADDDGSGRVQYNIPLEELDVIEGEEYLDV